MVIQIYASLFFLLGRPLTQVDQVFNPGGESSRRFSPSLLLTTEVKASVRPVCLFQLIAFLECIDDFKGVFFVDCGFDACGPSLRVDYIAFTSAWIETLKETTCEDPVLSTVYQLVQHGWPKERRRVPNVAKYYWDFRDELSTDEGLLLKGPSLIIPATLRENYLQRLHEGHLSPSKMITNARQHMFWPGIEADIKAYTRRCQVCIKRSRPAREPLQPHEIPDGPWQKLGMDFFDLKGKCYILICDYFSKFPFMFSCKTSWGSLKDHLIDLFSNEGSPKEIISDNSSPFNSQELQTISPAMVSNILHHHPTIPRVTAS